MDPAKSRNRAGRHIQLLQNAGITPSGEIKRALSGIGVAPRIRSRLCTGNSGNVYTHVVDGARQADHAADRQRNLGVIYISHTRLGDTLRLSARFRRVQRPRRMRRWQSNFAIPITISTTASCCRAGDRPPEPTSERTKAQDVRPRRGERSSLARLATRRSGTDPPPGSCARQRRPQQFGVHQHRRE